MTDSPPDEEAIKRHDALRVMADGMKQMAASLERLVADNHRLTAENLILSDQLSVKQQSTP